MSESSSTFHIIQSLAVNVVIAVAKGVAAVITGSGAMMAETLHSFADCGNQLLLLVGVHKSKRAPDASHPLGYGRDLYFWSFLVALLLFTGGGMFSIYEGIHKIRNPEPVEHVFVAYIVLIVSFALEGWSTLENVRELNRRRGSTGFFRYLIDTKDSDLIVVFGENSAAVVGLTFAMATLGLAAYTGNGRWDGIGSLSIGCVLVGVAAFLATEVKSLLVGESAPPSVEAEVRAIAEANPNIDRVLRVLTIQQGPGEVMLAMKIQFRAGLTTGGELCEVINAFERDVRAGVPVIRWSFIEPDVTD